MDHLPAWLGLLGVLIGLLSTWRLLWAPRRADLLDERKRAYLAFYSAAREREEAWAPLLVGLMFGVSYAAMEKAIRTADSGGLAHRFEAALDQVKAYGSDPVVGAALRVEECFTSFRFDATSEFAPNTAFIGPLQEAMTEYEREFSRDLGAGRLPLRGRSVGA
jgi:hypothetical protein